MPKHQQHKALKPKKSQHKRFLEVYWPYVPLLIIILAGLFGGVWRQSATLNNSEIGGSVLSYATNVSHSGLLSNTNSARLADNLPPLSLNWTLSSAAQSKANHMIENNYWAHTAPDGTTPWYFIGNAGYSYQNAGENLAYGFLNSEDTVVGWMNSPGHRANILGSYTEVGFGFANGAAYNGSGEQTVVVAMYGTPLYQQEPTPTPAPPSQPPTQPEVQSINTPTPTSNIVQPIIANDPTATPEPVISNLVNSTESSPSDEVDKKSIATNTIASNKQTRISKIQQLTGGKAPWSIYLVSIGITAIIIIWILKHLRIIRKAFVSGEDFVLHHPIFDITVALLLVVAIYLSKTTGIVL